jgi:serine/threonine-protein kinase
MRVKAQKTDRLIGLVALCVVLLASETDVLRAVEYQIYDLVVQLLPARKPSDEAVVVAIDEQSLRELGPWPWSRDVLALAQRRLNDIGPRVVAYTVSFEAAHNERGLEIMAAFRDEHRQKLSRQLRRQLQSAVNRLDTDHALAASFRDSGNVLLGFPYVAVQEAEEHTPARGASKLLAIRDARQDDGRLPSILRPDGVQVAAQLFPPTDKIAAGASGIAPDLGSAIGREVVRAVPLLLQHGDLLLPTLPLRAYIAHRGLTAGHLQLEAHGISDNDGSSTRDFGGRVHPFFYETRGEDGHAITTVSIAELLSGDASPEMLRDKTVFVGLTAPRFAPLHRTSQGQELPAVTITAQTFSALLNGDLVALSRSALLLRLGVLVLVGGCLIIVLPRLGDGTGLILSGLLVVLMLNAEFFMLLLRNVWLPLGNAIVLLTIGHLLFGAGRLIHNKLYGYQRALSDSNRMLGRTLQAQGQLDEAFAKYKQCVDSEETIGLLYSLGLDFERKRQFNKAADVFAHVVSLRRNYRDATARERENRDLDGRLMLGMNPRNSGGDTLIITGAGVQNPVLGRYEVEKELGRGAMGMVYLGRDPKIGRTVAIKTMALDQEFDAENLDEVKRRFFREAETAGRLNHPHIVTIYDVGEEHDLSYIAMDYIEGDPMSRFAEAGDLLPVPRVLDICTQVAEALHYAHENNVVHRDVKPGNIMYESDSRHATVTDFGVACLTDASRTKTGTILGSPSYMSPEQLEGVRIDGRSDLFSLGVTLFQLLTGQLPFVADSLSSLMYRIANESHPDPCKLRSDLPSCARAIINRALQKNAERRYANAAQMATALRRCGEKAGA